MDRDMSRKGGWEVEGGWETLAGISGDIWR